MAKSDLEERFLAQLHEAGIRPSCRELMFAKEAMGRKWRFDFAWPDERVAVEIQGGVWTRGKHGRGAGIVKDYEKGNAACVLGWRVLKGDASMIRDGSLIDALKQCL